MTVESAAQKFTQYEQPIFDILAKPGSEWTRQESLIIEKLVSEGHRDSLKLAQVEVRK